MIKDPDYWIMDEPPDIDANVMKRWAALVSENAGGIVAVGQFELMSLLMDLLLEDDSLAAEIEAV